MEKLIQSPAFWILTAVQLILVFLILIALRSGKKPEAHRGKAADAIHNLIKSTEFVGLVSILSAVVIALLNALKYKMLEIYGLSALLLIVGVTLWLVIKRELKIEGVHAARALICALLIVMAMQCINVAKELKPSPSSPSPATPTVAVSPTTPPPESTVPTKMTPSEQLFSPGRDGRPSAQDIIDAGDGSIVEFPKDDSYLEEYQVMYIHAEKGSSVYARKHPYRVENETYMPWAYHGTRVTVLANQKDYSCILYHSEENELHAAWVPTTYLDWNYPGNTLYVGEAVSYREYVVEPKVEWSKQFFEIGKQKYTNLETPIENCVAFTLDYKLLSRNGAGANEVYGPRTVYVKDDSGWREVGFFDYSERDPVHVVVTLDEPITLKAVATVATCAKPDTFLFRQSLLDAYVA